MKKYLIEIKADNGARDCVSINGGSYRPFQIAGNLWNYQCPGYAARRLETLAKAWENNGLSVKRVYGTVFDMPQKGNSYNIGIILSEYRMEAIRK